MPSLVNTLVDYLSHSYVSPSEATALTQNGVGMIGTLHMHSRAFHHHGHVIGSKDVPCVGKNHPYSLLAQAEQQGVGVVAITDHNTDSSYRQLYSAWHHGRKVAWLRATELSLLHEGIGHETHLIFANIPNDAASDHLLSLAHQPIDAYPLMREMRNAGVYAHFAHPWWPPHGDNLRSHEIWKFIRDHHLPVELNLKRSLAENIATVFLAAQYGLPLVSTPDSHTGHITSTQTYAPGNNVQEFLSNIQAGKSRTTTHLFNGNSWLLFHPKMMAEYMVDAMNSTEPTELGIHPRLDHIIERLSHMKLVGSKKGATEALVYAASYVAGFFYVMGSYGKSLKRVKEHFNHDGHEVHANDLEEKVLEDLPGQLHCLHQTKTI